MLNANMKSKYDKRHRKGAKSSCSCYSESEIFGVSPQGLSRSDEEWHRAHSLLERSPVSILQGDKTMPLSKECCHDQVALRCRVTSAPATPHA